jgi:hypothetical protein
MDRWQQFHKRHSLRAILNHGTPGDASR